MAVPSSPGGAQHVDAPPWCPSRGGAYCGRPMVAVEPCAPRDDVSQHDSLWLLSVRFRTRAPADRRISGRRCAIAGRDPPRRLRGPPANHSRHRARAWREHATVVAGSRPCHRGSRAGGFGRRVVRRVRGASHDRGRGSRDRRAGRDKLDDPQLSGIPARNQRGRPGVPRMGAGAAVRRRVRLHSTCHRTRLTEWSQRGHIVRWR